jgi:hypothetical protein
MSALISGRISSNTIVHLRLTTRGCVLLIGITEPIQRLIVRLHTLFPSFFAISFGMASGYSSSGPMSTTGLTFCAGGLHLPSSVIRRSKHLENWHQAPSHSSSIHVHQTTFLLPFCRVFRARGLFSHLKFLQSALHST